MLWVFFFNTCNRLNYCFKLVTNSGLIKWLINLGEIEAMLYAYHCLLQNYHLKCLRLMHFSADVFLFSAVLSIFKEVYLCCVK